MPDARWYEQMYGGRDENLLPLEPGHKYFLADALAPRNGELLNIGCGTGNFLAAARDAAYTVPGIELDRSTAGFSQERLGLIRVFGRMPAPFPRPTTSHRFALTSSFAVLS